MFCYKINILAFFLIFVSISYATKLSRLDSNEISGKQTKITHFFNSTNIALSGLVPPSLEKDSVISTVGTKRPINIAPTENRSSEKIVKLNETSLSLHRALHTEKSENLSKTVSQSSRTEESFPEMKISFLHGTGNHILAYSNCIDEVESEGEIIK